MSLPPIVAQEVGAIAGLLEEKITRIRVAIAYERHGALKRELHYADAGMKKLKNMLTGVRFALDQELPDEVRSKDTKGLRIHNTSQIALFYLTPIELCCAHIVKTKERFGNPDAVAAAQEALKIMHDSDILPRIRARLDMGRKTHIPVIGRHYAALLKEARDFDLNKDPSKDR